MLVLIGVVLLQVLMLSSADLLPTSDLPEEERHKQQLMHFVDEFFMACMMNCTGMSEQEYNYIGECGRNKVCTLKRIGGLSKNIKYMYCGVKCILKLKAINQSAISNISVVKAKDKTVSTPSYLHSNVNQHRPLYAPDHMVSGNSNILLCMKNCMGLNFMKVLELFKQCHLQFECWVSKLGPSAASCVKGCLRKKK
eukprot:m.306894 g.306894  ORF g.306894 m.306894 type:complete len:196 (+) comp41685_c0_seq1:3874-4461(+)